jgi:hypothetical protein
MFALDRTEQMKETGINHCPEWSRQQGNMERIADAELDQPADIRCGCGHLGTGLINCSLSEIHTQDDEAALGKGKRKLACAAPDVEHGTSGGILVEQRHQRRLRLADVPRWRLVIGRIKQAHSPQRPDRSDQLLDAA